VASSLIIGPWRMKEKSACGYPLLMSRCESVTGNFDNLSNFPEWRTTCAKPRVYFGGLPLL
jgi:hypothetical protein